jgi:hypothetical protein
MIHRSPVQQALTSDRLRSSGGAGAAGVFLSVVDLQAAINCFVLEHSAEPKPFTWIADPGNMAVSRGLQALDSIH